MSLASELLYLADLSEYARTGPKKPPQSLTAFIVRSGGLRDTGHEVRSVIGGARGRPGLVNNRSGLDLDDAAHLAWERGYLVSADRPCINAFLNALDNCVRGASLTSVNDAEDMEAFEAAENARDDLDQLGILAPCARKQKRVEAALRTTAEALA